MMYTAPILDVYLQLPTEVGLLPGDRHFLLDQLRRALAGGSLGAELRLREL